jgi:hypothetical protein
MRWSNSLLNAWLPPSPNWYAPSRVNSISLYEETMFYNLLSYSTPSLYSKTYSNVPSSPFPPVATPRLTCSPLALTKSSTVFNVPSSVDSLNQPKWSAIR